MNSPHSVDKKIFVNETSIPCAHHSTTFRAGQAIGIRGRNTVCGWRTHCGGPRRWRVRQSGDNVTKLSIHHWSCGNMSSSLVILFGLSTVWCLLAAYTIEAPGPILYKHNGFVMYGLDSKLVCLSKTEDTSLLRNLSISRNLRIHIVL
jgi:hypothetical protein